LQSSLAR